MYFKNLADGVNGPGTAELLAALADASVLLDHAGGPVHVHFDIRTTLMKQIIVNLEF